MLKRVFHKLLGYKVKVNIPSILEVGNGREWITTKAWLSEDCTVRCNVAGTHCCLSPDGSVIGFPTSWGARWEFI